MIDKIFIAPTYLPDEDAGLAFALEEDLGLEIASLAHPKALADAEKNMAGILERYQSIRRWRALQAPSVDMNPISLDSEVALISLHRYVQAMAACKALKCKYIIFQSPYSPTHKVAGNYQAWVSEMAGFWKKFIEEQLRATDIMILIANHMEEEPAQLMDLVTRIDSHKVRICLDMGNANIYSRVPVMDWLDTMGTDVEYVRASNNDGKTNTHNSFEDGKLEMSGFINHMTLLPQRLHLSLEVNSVNSMKYSFEMIKPYLEVQQQQMTTKSLII